MDPIVLEAVLQDSVRETKVRKILSVEAEPAVATGQNFLSVIKRLRMKVVLGSGRVVNRTAIFKDSNLPSESHSFFLKELGIFKTEITMYTTVLKEMEHLMEEFDCSDDVLWCRLLHHMPYSYMLLEDLRAVGFRSLLIPCYLDTEHAQLALNSLGLFHGMSKVLQERGVIREEDFPPWYVFNKTAYRIWHSYLQEFVNIICKKWDPSWAPIANKLKKLTVCDIEERMEKMARFEGPSFKVLNHGDIIIPNVMFKYDWKNRPMAMRFIDFQLPTFGTPCFDLTYFIKRGLRASFIKENFQQILEWYHSSLITTLDKFNYKGEKPSLDELTSEMERVSFLGSILFLVNYCPMPSSEGDFGADLHKERLLSVFNREDSEQEIGPGIKELVEKYLS